MRFRFLTIAALLTSLAFLSPKAYAQCTSPAGVAGDATFNSSHNVPVYCDGTNWIGMVGADPQSTGPAFPSQYYAFVSGPLPNGDIVTEAQGLGYAGTDGVLAGDYICQNEAEAAGLPGTYYAWLSGPATDNNAPSDRFFQSGVDYVMPNSPTFTVVANSWSDLTNGDIDNNIQYTADGTVYSGNDNVWTNVNDDGTADGTSHCQDWTSGSSGESGRRGDADNTDGNWTDNGSSNCNSSNRHIYCFQQPNITSQSTEIVPSGLVGHWRLDETSGTTIYDSSGNGYHGTFSTNVSTRTEDGPVGNALRFSSQNLTITNPALDNIDELTMCFWVRNAPYGGPSGSSTNYIQKVDAYEFEGNRSSLNGRMQDGGYRNFDFSNFTFDHTTWHHRCGTYSASNSHAKNVFINGVSSDGGVSGISDPGDDSGNPILIGGTAFHTSYLDDIRLYNRVLSEAEIREIYNARDGIRYNESYRNPEFFDGNKWVSVRPNFQEVRNAPIYAPNVSGCPNIGDVCSDGSVYAGLSPDGNLFMYTTPADAPSNESWNNGNALGQVNTSAADCSNTYPGVESSCQTGEANTAILASEDSDSITSGTQEHQAAQYCADLNVHGNDDWYLPSQDELVTLCNNRTAIGGFTTNYYWSSSEYDAGLGIEVAFPGCFVGVYSQSLKQTAYPIRCVRRDTVVASGTGGLVGHWKLDETSGTTAFDSSGNGNDGTMQNGLDASNESVPGAVGGALEFMDVLDDSITVPHNASFDPTNPTLAGWVKLTSSNPNTVLFGRRLGTSDPFNSFIIRVSGLGVGCSASTGVSGSQVNSSLFGLNENEWYHLACTYDGTNTYFYVNGNLEFTTAFAGPIGYNTTDFQIGDDLTGASGDINAALDDLRFYDRALDATEITTLYNMGAPVGSSTALPQGCPTVGDVCDDGTIYAGDFDDGSGGGTQSYYVTPNDESPLPFNNGNTSGYVSVTTDDSEGENNTLTLITTDSDSVTAGFQPHQAAQLCYDKVEHGADDWFLGSRNEVRLLLCLQPTAFPDVSYWQLTSGQSGGTDTAWAVRDDCVTQNSNGKATARAFRCFRKGPAPRCANPYGMEGDVFYNTTHNVLQYCDSARWIAIGKDN